MLMLSNRCRFFLYQTHINMRKSFEGLIQAIEKIFPEDIFSGSYFIFLNRKKDLMKILYWDEDGFVIWYKRLEVGSFPCKKNQTMLSRREFSMMIEGVISERFQKRFSFKKEEISL